jgi:hypothetical protein
MFAAIHGTSTATPRRAPTVPGVPALLIELVAWLLIVSGSCVSGCSWWAMRAQGIRR